MSFSTHENPLPRCFMGYDPAEDHENERFYVMTMPELTIYGHTVDHWTQRDYPEDWPLTEEGRRHGREFACWHSVMCPDGEIGTNPAESLVSLPFELFALAATQGFPHLTGAPLTTDAPVSAVGYINEHGEVVWEWDSLHGDRNGER